MDQQLPRLINFPYPYRETLLLFDEKISAITNKENIASVMAHELAHQWFGNIVTMKWWTDLWLNEGIYTIFGKMKDFVIWQYI